ncbi:Focal adhesion kinase 1 [Fasciola gigantica]|uniref:Focal adhesion kinase 1 n=1 Tax=Fasciola gigantica TaxID=46835 RepID=A0A504ZAI2_FASGI|nr:Focal adhesion kinase 1 [Fasciola gigantica]
MISQLRHYLLARNGQIALPLLLTFCYQIVTALTCLEAKRCVHRDIAARNILVARSDWVKLADFGMARMLYDANEFRADKGRKMPIKWMAPESVHHRRFSSASDVWMFGVCMWEILSGGTKPFADMTNAEAAEHVTRGQRLKRPELCPRNLYVVMLECWNTNPQRRPTFAALKPRLRELAAQSREAAKSDYQNSDNNALLANPEANDPIPDNLPVNSNHCSSGKVSSTRKPRTNHHHSSGNRKQYAQHTSQHGNSSTAKLPSLHSRWEEVTELEPTGEDSDNGSSRYETSHDFTDGNGQKNKIQSSVNMNDTRTGAVRNTTGSSRSKSLGNTHHQCHSNRRTSPERSRTQTTHLETNVPNYTGVTASGHNRLHSAPNINRDTSPKRKVTGGYDSSEPSSPRSKERVTRHSSNRRRSFEDGTDNQLASDHSRTQNNNCGAHCSETGFRNTTSHILTEKQPESIVYDEEFPETNNDRVYLSTVQVVKTVRLASQQLAVAPVEKYPLLVKSIGASVRDLFTSIETEFGANNIDNEIFLAERQLNASMYQLISTIKDAKLSINRGPLLEEYRRHLLTLCYAIAADAHSLYTSVYEFRNRPVSSRISPS